MADFLLKLLIALVLASAAGCGSAQQEEQNQIEEVTVNPIEVKPITVEPLDSSEILWETVITQTWD